MPNIIQHKRSSASGTVPSATGLAQGELGINIADGKLYTKNSSNNIINLGITSISGTSITPASGNFTQSLQVNGTGVSISGHTHTSSDITNFNSSVSGLLPVKDIIAGSGIQVGSTSGTYTITAFGVAASSASSLITRADNMTGATISKMSVVYINGGHGNRPTIQKSIGSAESTSSKTYGITASNINDNQTGDIVVFGALIDVNTNQFGASEGSTLYLSPSISGGITATKPLAPNHLVAVGKIVRNHNTQGIIEVSIQNGFELYELHDVAVTGATSGQFLQYNSSSGLWVPSSSGNFSTLLVNGTGVSVSGHTHTASNITDFNTAVSGLLPSVSGSGFVNSSFANNTYTISVTGLQPAGSYIKEGDGVPAGDVFVGDQGWAYIPADGSLSDVIGQIDTAFININAGKSDITHTHGNISSSGAIGSTSGLLVITGSSGILTTSSSINSSLISNFNSSVSGLLPTGTSNYLSKFGVGGSGLSNSLIFDNGTNVGIGTTTPSGRLDVAGQVFIRSSGNNISRINLKSGALADNLLSLRTDTNGNIILDGGGPAVSLSSQGGWLDIQGYSTFLQVGHTYNAGTIAQHLRFTPGGSELMRMTNSGTIGIGLPLTSNLFNIQPFDNCRLHIMGSGANSSSSALNVANSGNSSLLFVRNDGNVGIGTTSPTSKLHVAGDVLASGSFIAGSGSAALPSFEFVNDTDTGLFSPAANTFGISTSGVERLRIINNGNIGINYSAPTTTLQVNGSFSCGSSSDPSVGGQGLYLDPLVPSLIFNDSSGPNTTVTINNDGLTLHDFTSTAFFYTDRNNARIGIGTATPSETLDVNGTFKSAGFKSYGIGWFGASDGSLGLGVNTNPSGTFDSSSDFVALQGFNDVISTYNPICLTTQNAAQLYLNTDGNVGIGTATPSEKLHVVGTSLFANEVKIGSLGNDPGILNVYTNDASDASAQINLKNGGSVDRLSFSVNDDNGESAIISTSDTFYINNNAVNGIMNIGANTINLNGNVTFDSFTESVVAIGNSSTSKTINLTSGTVQTCTLTGNCTFTMPTATAGKSFNLFLNSGSGNYTAVFTGVRWADSASPTATILANKVDIYSFISDGTYWYGSFSQNYG